MIDIEFNSGAQLPLDAIPELARLAEAHGFGCAWGGEANNKDPTVMLSAIAAVVLGGTLLTGGVGLVVGALFGGMILGLIATLINFNGSLNGAWIMISSGILLFVFIVMQRALVGSLTARTAH